MSISREVTRPVPTSSCFVDDMALRPTADVRLGHHTTATLSALTVPTFERYEIVGELGRGGMGVVYKAVDRDLKRPVAIKMILHGQHAAFDVLTRFKAETEAVGRLDHPNLVRIYETGHVEGRPFAVMEFIDGGTLADHLAFRTFTPLEAARIIADLADAVDSAHQSGVLHRDLKPANILLRGEQPKVVDFGLAKLEGAVDCTQTGDVIGTPNYMAPERVTGPKTEIGVGVDIYALGAILYELLTKHTPIEGATPVEVLRRVLDEEVPSVRTLRRDVARDLDTICLKCLQKRPHQRYATAKELADDLRRYLRGEPIKARPVRTWERFSRWAKRHPTIAVTLGLLFTVLASVAVGSTLAAQSYHDLATKRQEDIQRAENNQRQAESNERDARWNAYTGHMAAVASHLQLNNYGTAKSMLETAPEEHRGWEWHYFNAQMDLSERTNLRFPSMMRDVVAGSDGQTLFVLTASGELVVIDTATHAIRDTRTVAPSPIKCATWSADNRLLAVGLEGGRLGCYDIAARTFETFATPTTKGASVVTLSPDHRYLLGALEGERTAYAIDRHSKRMIPLPHDEETYRLHVLGDNRTAFITTHAALYWWSLVDGKQLARVATPYGAYDRWALSTDRRYLAMSYFYPDLTVRVWDVVARRWIATLTGHTNTVLSMTFTADNRQLVTAGHDQTVRRWNVADGRELRCMEGHTQVVQSVALTADERTIVSGSEDGTVRLWDMTTGTLQTVLHGQAEAVYGVVLPPQSPMLVTRGGHSLRWFNLDTIRKRTELGRHERYVYGLAVAPDGHTVASCGWDNHVRLWNLNTGQALAQYPHQKRVLSAVAFHPQGSEMAVVERSATPQDCAVYRWQRTGDSYVRHEQQAGSWRIDTNPAYSPDGQWLAVGGAPNGCHVWPIAAGAPMKYVLDPTRPNGPLTGCVAWSPDGTQLTSVTEDGEVVVWQRGTTTPVRRWPAHRDVINALQYSPDGRQIITAGGDLAVRFWNAATGELLANLRHGSKVYHTALHPTEHRLATACSDGSIRLWDTQRHEEVAELRGHTSYVKSLLFTPDGNRLLSASGDGTVRIWDKRPLRRE